MSKANDETCSIAAKLISFAEGVLFYNWISLTKVIPNHENIMTAKTNLIFLSNSFNGTDIGTTADRSNSICKLLNIEFMDD